MRLNKKRINHKDLYLGEIKISDLRTHERLDKFSFKNLDEFDKRIKTFFDKFM